MNKILPILLLLISAVHLLAQDKRAVVTGTVRNMNGLPAYNVSVSIKDEPGKGAITDDKGGYKILVLTGKPTVLIFSSLEYKADTITLNLVAGERRQLDVSLKPGGITLDSAVITSGRTRDEIEREIPGTVLVPVEEAKYLPNASGGDISALLLTTALGVGTAAGELSTTYTVRGGNYDENLVYVNDFEVYRPFLIRSGQQEGLSFVNTDLIGSLTFSSGGFQAKYGDKLSSVLDAEYKKPKAFHGSASFGLLGGSVHLEGIIKRKKDTEARATYLFGVRQKSSQYLLNSLETKGEYSPSFTDVQGYITVKLTNKLSLEWIGNYAQNKFTFIPTDRTTTFGTVNNVIRLTIYFDGQERDQYESAMTGLSLIQKVNDKLKFKWMASAYRSTEEETYDIRGEYYLDAVESDLSSSKFGQVKYNLGVGALQDFARDYLTSTVVNTEHKGYYTIPHHQLTWGLKYQHEIINDKLHEWEELDSAGYSLPYTGNQVSLHSYLDTRFNLNSNRYSGYFQDSWRVSDAYGVTFTYGCRFSYWSVNKEFIASPRAQISIKPTSFNHPDKNRDIVFTAAVGMYAQPPFYREMRNFQGDVNLSLKAQKSVQAVLGANYNFLLWNRKFSFITEAYYKYLYDLVPYEFDNVLIRYFGTNNAKGYSTGIDFRLNGEFVKNTDSYINLSLLSTKENITDDYYTYGIDKHGNVVQATSDSAVKHATGYPGYIPRPTDQTVRFTMFFQDYIPRFDALKVHLNFVFATGLPFGPPNHLRYEDTLRIPPYRRVDIGFSALLFSKAKKIEKGKRIVPFMKVIQTIWATFEIYNLLGVNNTVSYIWVRDIHNSQYAVPNYLSSRRINVRLAINF